MNEWKLQRRLVKGSLHLCAWEKKTHPCIRHYLINLKGDTIPLLQVVRDIDHSVCPLMLVTGTFLYVESWGLFGNDAHTSSPHDIYRFQRLNISFQNTTEGSNPDITKSTAEGQRKMSNNAISQFLSKMEVSVNYFRILVNSISKYWVPPSLLLKGHGLSRGRLYHPLRTAV